jgi:hypothetical protein
MKYKTLLLGSLLLLLLWPSGANSQETSPKEAPATAPATTNSVPAPPENSTNASADTKKADVKEPKDLGEAVAAGQAAVKAAQAGEWWYFSSVVCLVIMFVLKALKLLKKMGRWKYVVLPVLSLAAALLAAFQGGVGIAQAVGVFGSAWAMGMLEELVNHGILGKPHESSGTSG